MDEDRRPASADFEAPSALQPPTDPFAPGVMALVLDTIEELVVLIDREGHRAYVSPSYQRVLGDDASAGTDSLVSVHPEDRERIRKLLDEVFGSGEGQRTEYRYIVSDGTQRIVESQSTPVFGSDGRVSHVLVVSRDVTEARRQAQAVRALELERFALVEQRLDLLIRTAGDAVITIDERSVILDWNTAAERLFGWSREEALGREVQDLIVPERWRAMHKKGLQHYLDTGEAKLFGAPNETQALRRDGSEFPVELSIWPVRVGQSVTFSSFIRDISERKQREEDVRRALARERELNELKSRFITMTSHEFRTPLATIQSSIELIERYEDKLEPGEREELIESIRQSVKRSAQMLDDILMIGKADAGRLDFAPCRDDLGRFCTELVAAFQISAPPQIAIDYRIDVAAPPGQAWFDAKLLRLTLSNLLANAVKYSPAPATVTLTVSQGPEHVRFVVRDQGIGIPAEDLPHLFGSFHRGTNVGNRPGAGLGLAIAKRALDLQQGHIDVVSELNHGTTVTLDLPITPPPGR